jgi:hypothetical protein
VSSVSSPCYALVGFLRKILRPLAGKSEFFFKNSGHFIELLKCVNLLRSLYTPFIFKVVSFHQYVRRQAIQVFSNKLHIYDILTERSVLQVGAIIQLLDVCLTNLYFQLDDMFFQRELASL